jgi:hypothetical protein
MVWTQDDTIIHRCSLHSRPTAVLDCLARPHPSRRGSGSQVAELELAAAVYDAGPRGDHFARSEILASLKPGQTSPVASDHAGNQVGVIAFTRKA